MSLPWVKLRPLLSGRGAEVQGTSLTAIGPITAYSDATAQVLQIIRTNGSAGTAGIGATDFGKSLLLYAGDVERVRVAHDTGNVGIGTTIPGAKLDVNGNVQVGGSITAGHPITANGSGNDGRVNARQFYALLANGQEGRLIADQDGCRYA